MISTRYMSFLSGIAIASLTWGFSLYLYSKLSQNTVIVSSTVAIPEISHQFEKSLLITRDEYNNKEVKFRNNAVISPNEQQMRFSKQVYNSKDNRYYKDNDHHLHQLPVVPVKSTITLDQGIILN